MVIVFDSISLTPSDTERAFDLTLNGEQVVRPVDLVGAAQRIYYGRGNRSEGLQFSVVRGFDTARAAQEFFLKHPADLPDTGDLVITCGDTGDTADVTCTDAIFKGVQRRLTGKAVALTYTFVGGVFA